MARPPSKNTKKSKTKKQTPKPPKKAVKTSAGKSAKKTRKIRSSKKGLLITALILVFVIGAGIAFLLTNLNFLVKMAIEKYGSQATQTAVRVKGVHIILKDGAGSIEGLTIANPKGFKTKHAFSLGEIGVDINLRSLTSDEIRIDEIVIRAPKIFVEVNADKKNNLNEIKNNLPAGTQSATKSVKKESKEEPLLFIRRIRFSEGQIDTKITPINKEYQLRMPSIEMRNLRGTPGQIALQVITKLTNRALKEVKKKGIDQARSKISDRAKSQLEFQKKKAADKVKDLLGK